MGWGDIWRFMKLGATVWAACWFSGGLFGLVSKPYSIPYISFMMPCLAISTANWFLTLCWVNLIYYYYIRGWRELPPAENPIGEANLFYCRLSYRFWWRFLAWFFEEFNILLGPPRFWPIICLIKSDASCAFGLPPYSIYLWALFCSYIWTDC